MIRTALKFIQSELERYIVAREQDPSYSPGQVVDLKSVIKPNGDSNITDTTHVTLMLVGVDEVRREGKRPYYVATSNQEFAKLNPPLELDLFVLFVANNAAYDTALRDLSDVIAFFQSNPVFDAAHYPALNDSVSDQSAKPWQLIERLSTSVHSMGFDQMNNLWGILGSRYMPSIAYRVRMLTFFETRSREQIAAITDLHLGEN